MARSKLFPVEEVQVQAVHRAVQAAEVRQGRGSWVPLMDAYAKYTNKNIAPLPRVSTRQFLVALHALEARGRVELRVVSLGRYGRRTMIRVK